MSVPADGQGARLSGARRKAGWRKLVRWVLAGINLVLAVVGAFLPVIQGALHFVIAVALLAPDVPAARRLTLWLYRKLPRVRRTLPRTVRNLTRKERE